MEQWWEYLDWKRRRDISKVYNETKECDRGTTLALDQHFLAFGLSSKSTHFTSFGFQQTIDDLVMCLFGFVTSLSCFLNILIVIVTFKFNTIIITNRNMLHSLDVKEEGKSFFSAWSPGISWKQRREHRCTPWNRTEDPSTHSNRVPHVPRWTSLYSLLKVALWDRL